MEKRMLWPIEPGKAREAWETWGRIATNDEKRTVEEITLAIRHTIDERGTSRIGTSLGVMLTLSMALEHLADDKEMSWNTEGMSV